MYRSPFWEAWTLDPEIIFLNHGSFGACPREVLAYQQHLRQQLERQPLRFLGREIEARLDEARSVLANFVGADPTNLAFVPNATTGVNAVLRSLNLQPGNELLTTNQEYNACRNALNYIAERSGATIVIADIPFPVASPDTIVQAVCSKVSDQTRLVLLDHVVSQTALILPIAEIIATLNSQGIESLIDGAHVPGMIPLDLRSLGATYYTGNCHKWLCAPKGAAFLYVQPDRQTNIHPTTISHGRNDPRTTRSRFHLEFDWMGTGDPTAYLSVPKAIEYLGSLLPTGWTGLMEHNHNLAITARQSLSQILEIATPCPDEMLGSMATLPLPDGDAQELYQHLWQGFNLEVPIIPFPAAPQRLIRISAQIYNTLSEYKFLGETLRSLL
ncbi:MAG: penicillin epimerase [Alkalinema sp. CACIAM 70d]|nr:MAG: penicillin epimerase [Alkalinema sp. CACIAM 70d]